MKEIKKILAVLLILNLMMAACGHVAAEQELRKMETAEDAGEWIRVFLGVHPEELEGLWAMTPQMQQAAAMSGGIKGLAASLVSLGKAERIETAYEGEIKGYKAFYIPCVFSAVSVDLILVIQDGMIAGLSTGLYSGGKEEPAESVEFRSMDLALPVPSMNRELPGTLTLPNGEGPFSAVVLIHGSGASDRDESIMNLKPFRDLAEGLTERGIAVYRFDKRTYVFAKEMAEYRQGTLVDESVEDAVNAVQLLAAQEKIDPDRIFVLGHSLGGNAIPAIARALRDQPFSACGYMMLAASPRPLDELIREQYDYLFSLTPEVTEEQQAQKDELFSDLDRLKDPDSLTDDDLIAGAYAPYWKWLAKYDILTAADEITEPCLLLQGEEDYQVTMKDFGIWKESFGEKENWQLISYPGLTHCFTPGLKTEGSAVYTRSEKVSAEVIQDIAVFISSTEANP